MKKPVAIVGGILGVLIGMGLVMPAVALMNKTGSLPNFEVVLLILGLVLTLGGAAATVNSARRVRT